MTSEQKQFYYDLIYKKTKEFNDKNNYNLTCYQDHDFLLDEKINDCIEFVKQRKLKGINYVRLRNLLSGYDLISNDENNYIPLIIGSCVVALANPNNHDYELKVPHLVFRYDARGSTCIKYKTGYTGNNITTIKKYISPATDEEIKNYLDHTNAIEYLSRIEKFS